MSQQEEDDALKRRLEQATAPGSATLGDLQDAELQSLHETWLALGQLLEAAQPAEKTRPAIDLPRRKGAAARSSRWTKMIVVAAAASLLMAMGVGWALRTAVRFLEMPLAKQEQRQPPQFALDRSGTNPSRQAPSTDGVELKWDDSFDEQAKRFEESLLAARHDSSLENLEVSMLQYDMERLQQEIGDNKL